MQNSVQLNIFIELGKCYHHQLQYVFITPKSTPTSLSCYSKLPTSPAPINHHSPHRLYIFACSEYFILMESHNMWSFFHWVLSFNIMPTRFNSVIAHINIFFLFIAEQHFIVWLNHLPVHQLMEFPAVYTFVLLKILLQTLVYKLFCKHMFSFFCHWILSSERLRLVSPSLSLYSCYSFCLSVFISLA